MNNLSLEYVQWFKILKDTIVRTQIKAAVSVNTVLIELYWNLGKEILEKEKLFDWGDGFINQLALDLKKEFPSIKGFSRRNLYAIKQWYSFYSAQFEFVPQAVAQIPWGHNRLIISKIKDINTALIYAQATTHNGWSRDILELQVENNFHLRKGISTNNFSTTLPQIQSDLARETIKDPYHFDFLELEEDAQEREIEKQLTQKITEFLLELGKGFAFVGKQYKIEVSDNDYFIDLLFYHLDLRCYVVVELKAGKFKPEYAGKLNFYLSAVDAQLKHSSDSPSVGLILCRSKDKLEAEYALRDINKPIGISSYKLTQIIPQELKGKLPTVEEMEDQFSMEQEMIKSDDED
jgi:predicted nuclease of restriction endonuclease-like (RecB) superfamily